ALWEGLLAGALSRSLCCPEWELSKENVQPLKQGRVVSTLQGLLTHDGPSHMRLLKQKYDFIQAMTHWMSGTGESSVMDIFYIPFKFN
uniref:Uncharacterized protein n=1 Tax=Callorhinchus milii TaxID=7868 RepID=A0A4W3KDG4_CALMI